MAGRLHTTETVRIPSAGRDIRALVLRPTKSARPQAETPGILWIHGGGYFLGMPEMVFMSRARNLVDRYGAVVVSPAYRLAGEAPFPAALGDCYAALLFLRECAGALGVNDAQLMVGGESAGGGLAAATCLLARDMGQVSVAFQMPLYPMIDDRPTPSSRDNHAPVWNTARNRDGWRCYLGGLSGGSVPPYAAPAREADLSGLPPAYSFVGDVEPFYCETVAYFEGLRRAGVDAVLDVYPQWFHVYDMLLPFRRRSKEAIARFEKRYLHAVATCFAPQRA